MIVVILMVATHSSHNTSNSLKSSNLETWRKKEPHNERDTCPEIYWELNWLNQWDHRLIKFIKDELLIPPPKYSEKKLNLRNKYNLEHAWTYQGQHGEALVVEHLYGLNANGANTHDKGYGLLEKNSNFFIEAGATDGESISNTLYLELKYNWTGLLVEPNPMYLAQLKKKNRNAWILPYCLSPITSPTVVDFDAMAEYGGIINHINGVRKNPGDINSNNASPKPTWRKTLKIQCLPLYSVLRALGLPSVDYFSLDIEGAEYHVLKTIPFQDVDINLLGVEVEHAGKIFNGTEDDIINLLISRGYQYAAKTKLDKFFLKNKGRNKLSKPTKILSIS